MNNLEYHDKIPYYCVTLTADQVKQVRDRRMEIYACDGHVLFPLIDENNVKTGEYVFYVIFK